jgi:hypothetical protein
MRFDRLAVACLLPLIFCFGEAGGQQRSAKPVRNN